VRLERLSKFCERLNAEESWQTRSTGVEDKRRCVCEKSESGSKHTLKVYKLLQERKRWDKSVMCRWKGPDATEM
jgi:hypothetical protein